MDVDAAVERLVNALELGQTDEAKQACHDITEWMQKKGFAPRIKPHTLEFLLQELADRL